mmetsp:Transcript_37895/g.91405  ORF Transcript_37895/g.91405 Transcript_37895/m.91405 type:complete len:318 (-) Transcript_37895:270-1223(-)
MQSAVFLRRLHLVVVKQNGHVVKGTYDHRIFIVSKPSSYVLENFLRDDLHCERHFPRCRMPRMNPHGPRPRSYPVTAPPYHAFSFRRREVIRRGIFQIHSEVLPQYGRSFQIQQPCVGARRPIHGRSYALEGIQSFHDERVGNQKRHRDQESIVVEKIEHEERFQGRMMPLAFDHTGASCRAMPMVGNDATIGVGRRLLIRHQRPPQELTPPPPMFLAQQNVDPARTVVPVVYLCRDTHFDAVAAVAAAVVVFSPFPGAAVVVVVVAPATKNGFDVVQIVRVFVREPHVTRTIDILRLAPVATVAIGPSSGRRPEAR